MQSFLHRFRERIPGVLNGFDRVRFRGSLLRLASVGGMSRPSGWRRSGFP